MVEYLDFIKDSNVGLEGSSCWIWYKNRDTDVWESKGFAADTIEESLELLKQYMRSL